MFALVAAMVWQFVSRPVRLLFTFGKKEDDWEFPNDLDSRHEQCTSETTSTNLHSISGVFQLSTQSNLDRHPILFKMRGEVSEPRVIMERIIERAQLVDMLPDPEPLDVQDLSFGPFISLVSSTASEISVRPVPPPLVIASGDAEPERNNRKEHLLKWVRKFKVRKNRGGENRDSATDPSPRRRGSRLVGHLQNGLRKIRRGSNVSSTWSVHGQRWRFFYFLSPTKVSVSQTCLIFSFLTF